MFKRIIFAVLSVTIAFSCQSVLFACAENDDLYTTGGIWQSAEETPKDCGITVIECENETTIFSEIPKRFDISTNPDTEYYFPPIGNQGQMNSCAGWATTYYQFTYEVNKYRNTPTNDSNIMSPAWTYNYINGGQNVSATITDAYSVLMNQGALALADYPHSTTASNYSYSWSTDVNRMIDALRYRAVSFLYTVDTSSNNSTSKLSTIKSLISEGHVGVVWTNASGWSIETNNSGEKFIVRGSSRSKYGHFMTVVGYDDDIEITVNGVTLKGAFKVANSRGADWANDGYIWVSYDALNYTSTYGTTWQSKYKGTRTSGLGNAKKNNFYFIDVKECNVCFVGYIRYLSNDPWNLTLEAEALPSTPTKRWSSDTVAPVSNPNYRCLVFDFFNPIAIKNLNNYLSREWIVQLKGTSDYGTYRISSQILDNLGNPIAPIDTVYGALTNGIYSRTTKINLAKGRVTSYDDKEITSADSELILNYIVKNAEFSNLQKFLADYNNDGNVNIADVVLMNKYITSNNI